MTKVVSVSTDIDKLLKLLDENKIEAHEVVSTIRSAKTSGKKAAATKLLNRYVDQRVEDGCDPVRVRAAIKGVLAR